ncbi:response regulator [Methylolobus aquaticus]|uniref:response regulator n=1 Tax=Methylotetracoccus oryzae TaxID=1919059 RepID=UPI00111B2CD6|nr:response regulator transcription factor [Methylotetracoccus oryzae]
MINTISVMLVDDHAVVRAGYRLLLTQSSDIKVICEAERGEEACQLYGLHRPQVVVMDLSLPGIGGLATVRRLIARDPNARILMFSIHDEPAYVVRALEAGAKGYITKSCAPEILVEAVERIAGGQNYLEHEIAQKLALQTGTTAQSSSLNSLSAREFDVFCLLAKGYTTREVAEELRLGYKTVANYTTLIKSKLSVNTSAEMARLAYRHGLIAS